MYSVLFQFQCVFGFLVNDCVPMDTYMTRDSCDNYMFTNSNNGSKDGDRVASTAVFGHHVYSVRLPFARSIVSTEINAIIIALKFIVSCQDYLLLPILTVRTSLAN
jgi:hypothetical protein